MAAAAGIRGHRPDSLTRHSRFDKLGFDSLDRIALAVAVERVTGMPIPDHVLVDLRTLGDLMDHLTRSTVAGGPL
ncbi:MAG: acyl carrier protein [Sciscionella sp.]